MLWILLFCAEYSTYSHATYFRKRKCSESELTRMKISVKLSWFKSSRIVEEDGCRLKFRIFRWRKHPKDAYSCVIVDAWNSFCNQWSLWTWLELAHQPDLLWMHHPCLFRQFWQRNGGKSEPVNDSLDDFPWSDTFILVWTYCCLSYYCNLFTLPA